jgi:uncharacterized integral membrane protein
LRHFFLLALILLVFMVYDKVKITLKIMLKSVKYPILGLGLSICIFWK